MGAGADGPSTIAVESGIVLQACRLRHSPIAMVTEMIVRMAPAFATHGRQTITRGAPKTVYSKSKLLRRFAPALMPQKHHYEFNRQGNSLI
jgi:hypothetical protein